MSRAPAGSFAAFSIPNFRILFGGTLFSFTAFFMSTIVQSVVAFELTGLNGAVGGAIAGQGLGMVMCGPLGGAYADRLPKRRVIAVGQLISALSLINLGWLYSGGTITITNLVINSTIMGAAFGFIGPARQALVVDLVPDTLRGNAMAMTNVSNTVSRVAGPAVAGGFLAVESLGPAGAYFGMGVLYVLSALALLFLPKSVVRAGVADTHVFADLREGLVYAWQDVRLRNLLIFFITVMLTGFPYVALTAGWLEIELGRPKEQVAEVALVSALGALSASLWAARFADSSKATRVYSALGVAFGVALLLFGLAPGFISGLVAVFFVGAASGGFHALNGAVIARETDPRYMGRVMSLTFIAFAGFSLTAAPLGYLADIYGVRNVLFGMGLGVIVIALVMSARVARDARDAASKNLV